jgi:urea transporter
MKTTAKLQGGILCALLTTVVALAPGAFGSVMPGFSESIVGNNVVLTVVPEPNVLALTAAGCLLVCLSISRRRQS